jgi:hypothetical protein
MIEYMGQNKGNEAEHHHQRTVCSGVIFTTTTVKRPAMNDVISNED